MLLLQVLVLAALLLGLSRWAGRGSRPGAAGKEAFGRPDVSLEGSGTEPMSAPGDLTFYETLGTGRPVGTGGFSDPPDAPGGGPEAAGAAASVPSNGAPAGGGPTNKDAGRRRPEPGAGRTAAYIVQVLATRDAAVARRMRDRLAARGFPAVVLEDRSGGQVVYHVHAGRYRTREEADAAARVLRRGHLSPWVLQEGD